MLDFLGNKFIMVPIFAMLMVVEGVMVMSGSWYILMSYSFVLQRLWFDMMSLGAVSVASALVSVSRGQVM